MLRLIIIYSNCIVRSRSRRKPGYAIKIFSLVPPRGGFVPSKAEVRKKLFSLCREVAFPA